MPSFSPRPSSPRSLNAARFRAGRSAPILLLVIASLALAACGSDSSADELAKQRELAAAREQAAQDARQSERIKALERQLREQKRQETPSKAGGERAAPPSTQPPPEPSDDRPLDDWPGGSGYTAIIGSYGDEASAWTRQREATSRGLDSGVLLSTNYSSLRPGYWVVFSGTYATSGEASERASWAKELGYSDAYPRFVSR